MTRAAQNRQKCFIFIAVPEFRTKLEENGKQGKKKENKIKYENMDKTMDKSKENTLICIYMYIYTPQTHKHIHIQIHICTYTHCFYSKKILNSAF